MTPLQHYKKAYDLHHKENRIEDATTYYRKLIHDYPDSEVASYATIQLATLSSGYVKTNLRQVKNNGTTLFHTIISITAFVIAVSSVVISIYLFSVLKKQVLFNEKLFMVHEKLFVGDEDAALALLNELKIDDKNNINPYVMVADIHLKNNAFAQARKEFELYRQRNPSNILPSGYILSVNRAEDSYNAKKFAATQKKVVEDAPQIKKRVITRRESRSFSKPMIRSEVSYF